MLMLSRALALCAAVLAILVTEGGTSRFLQTSTATDHSLAPDHFGARKYVGLVSESPDAADTNSSSSDWGVLYPTYDILRDLEGLVLGTPHRGDEHKPLFPLSTGDIIGFVLVVAVLFIAAGGGIGGGGAIIPLYLLFLKFPTNIAVALGNITIVGGAISNFVFNVGRRHAFLNRPLIDWDLILVMEPSTILGALVGGYLNKTFPNWLTTLLLGILLTFISWKLVTRGVITWSKESRENQVLRDEELPLLDDEPAGPGTSGRSTPISAGLRMPDVHLDSSPLAYASVGSLSHSVGSFSFRRSSTSGGGGTDRQAVPSAMQEILTSDSEAGTPSVRVLEDTRSAVRRSEPDLSVLEEQASLEGDLPPAESLHLPSSGHDRITENGTEAGQPSGKLESEDDVNDEQHQKQLDEQFARGPQVPPLKFGVLVLLTAVVAASDYFKKSVPCGSWPYWLLVLSIIPAVLLVTLIARSYLVRQRNAKLAAGYIWKEGDIEWTPLTTLTYPAVCSVAGLVAGMFGVGGGIVKGPLMLEMGVLPDVASATSATMIVFTAASASIVFISFGGIPLDYGIAVFVLGLVFTMLGQIACYGLMKVLQRRSVIVFAMAALMILSLVITLYEAILGVEDAVHSNTIWSWRKICS